MGLILESYFSVIVLLQHSDACIYQSCEVGDRLTRSQVTGVKPQVRVSQSQVAELKLGSTLPTPNSRKGVEGRVGSPGID
jgi:hypothetical protein